MRNKKNLPGLMVGVGLLTLFMILSFDLQRTSVRSPSRIVAMTSGFSNGSCCPEKGSLCIYESIIKEDYIYRQLGCGNEPG